MALSVTAGQMFPAGRDTRGASVVRLARWPPTGPSGLWEELARTTIPAASDNDSPATTRGAFEVEGAGSSEVNGIYFMTGQNCDGADVFRKVGTSYALLRRGADSWSLADLRGSSTTSRWSLRSVELYRATRIPAGPTPPPIGWQAMEGDLPAPLVRAAQPSLQAQKETRPASSSGLRRPSSTPSLHRPAKELSEARPVSQGSSRPRSLGSNAPPPQGKLPGIVRPSSGIVVKTQAALARHARSPGGGNASLIRCFRIVLTRPSARVHWGFNWSEEAYKSTGSRLVESIERDSPLDRWNAWQRVRGRPSLCVTEGDRLLRVDGRWAYHESEVTPQDGDQAEEAVRPGGAKESEDDEEELGVGAAEADLTALPPKLRPHVPNFLVLDFSRPGPSRQWPALLNPPKLEVWNVQCSLVASWQPAGQQGVLGWALCLQHSRSGIWFMVDGVRGCARPVTDRSTYACVFPPEVTSVVVADGLTSGGVYLACVAFLTDEGWSAVSELSRPATMPAFANVADHQLPEAAIQEELNGPHFILPHEVIPGATVPIELESGTRTLLGRRRVLRLKLALRGGMKGLRFRATPQRDALLVEEAPAPGSGSSSGSRETGKHLDLHSCKVPLYLMPCDVVIRANGATGAEAMLEEINGGSPELALLVDRLVGGSAGDAEFSGEEGVFEIIPHLDSHAVTVCEELRYNVHLTPEEGMLASRVVQSQANADALATALQVATALGEGTRFTFEAILAEAKTRVMNLRRLATSIANIKANPVRASQWTGVRESRQSNRRTNKKSLQDNVDGTVPDEEALMKLKFAMAGTDAAQLQAAIKMLGMASKTVRNSKASQGLLRRAKSLHYLWGWRKKCIQCSVRLRSAVQDLTMRTNKRRRARFVDISDLNKSIKDAQPYSSELEFELMEATALSQRLQAGNDRYAAREKILKLAGQPLLDEPALQQALEEAEAAGVDEDVQGIGKRRIAKHRSKTEVEKVTNELFTAVKALEVKVEPLDTRESPVARPVKLERVPPGAEEQDQLRRAIATHAKKSVDLEHCSDAPLVEEAWTLLNTWEQDHQKLGLQALLLNAEKRALKGYSHQEPDTGERLASAIAKVAQEGIDPLFTAKAKDSLVHWEESRTRQLESDLTLAIEYEDQNFLAKTLAMSDNSNIHPHTLHQARMTLMRMEITDEVNGLLSSAIEHDDIDRVESAILRAHEALLREDTNYLLQSAVMQYHIRFCIQDFRTILLQPPGVFPTKEDLEGGQALAKQARAVLRQMNTSKTFPEKAYRTLERDVRTLEPLFPKIQELLAVHTARLDLQRILGAVERYAEQLPEALERGRKQGIDEGLLTEGEDWISHYDEACTSLSAVIGEGAPDQSGGLEDFQQHAEYAAQLYEEILTARLAGAPAKLIRTAQTRLAQVDAARWSRLEIEMELMVALREADDIKELPVEDRFFKLSNATDKAKKLHPPISDDTLEEVETTGLALAAERNLLLTSQAAEECMTEPGSPEVLEKHLEKVLRAMQSVRTSALPEAKKALPAADDLCKRLGTLAQDRRAAKVGVDGLTRYGSSDAPARVLFDALVNAREQLVPGSLLTEGYKQLRDRKLDNIANDLHTTRTAGLEAMAIAFYLRGVALGMAQERVGSSWRDSNPDDVIAAAVVPNGVLIQDVISGNNCGGSFGSRTWRQNPYYVVQRKGGPDHLTSLHGSSVSPRSTSAASSSSAYVEGKKSTQKSTHVTVYVVEGAAVSPATLAVHAVRNNHEVADVAGYVLAPGFEVIASSEGTVRQANGYGLGIPVCSFDLPEEDKEWPVLLVPSAAAGEEGPFTLIVEATDPIEVMEVPEHVRRPWQFEEVIEVEWSTERPLNILMGGGRPTGGAPPLSWYRNPQFSVWLSEEELPEEFVDDGLETEEAPTAAKRPPGRRRPASSEGSRSLSRPSSAAMASEPILFRQVSAASAGSEVRLRPFSGSAASVASVNSQRPASGASATASANRPSTRREASTASSVPCTKRAALPPLHAGESEEKLLQDALLDEVSEEDEKGRVQIVSEGSKDSSDAPPLLLALLTPVPGTSKEGSWAKAAPDVPNGPAVHLCQNLQSDGDEAQAVPRASRKLSTDLDLPDRPMIGLSTSEKSALTPTVDCFMSPSVHNNLERRRSSMSLREEAWRPAKLMENPVYHEVLGTGHADDANGEVGAIAQWVDGDEPVIIVPSLPTKASMGKYLLKLFCTKQVTVQRVF